MPKHDIKLMVTCYVWLFVTCGYHDTSDRSRSIPSRSSFPSKKIDGSDAELQLKF